MNYSLPLDKGTQAMKWVDHQSPVNNCPAVSIFPLVHINKDSFTSNKSECSALGFCKTSKNTDADFTLVFTFKVLLHLKAM